MAYTNAQFRSILNGLGFGYVPEGELTDPISTDNNPLIDRVTRDAIEDFQKYFNLQVDGIAGAKTMAMAERQMRVLQAELNQVVGANLPKNQPFYGPRTISAIKEFQRRYGFVPDGFAVLPVRQKLLAVSKPQGVTH
ncbi:MAG: peptidoglycan-binding protein [Myxacorys californica WJT36-NPBG1]|jgi:peptidoglycan hydrolase-like protein with peptidoglycan-binding domain|nr:peptidoglycan-binding protein [Myxacorys californica WJT36-NPBG1]